MQLELALGGEASNLLATALEHPTDFMATTLAAQWRHPVTPNGEGAYPALVADLRRFAQAAVYGLRSETSQVPRARAATHAAVSAYWAAVTEAGATNGFARLARCPLEIPILPSDVTAQAEFIGRAAADLAAPLAAYLLSTLYTAMLPGKLRAANGVFYTPPAVADRLLDLVEDAGADWTRDTVADPAAGGGAFVAPVATRVAARLEDAGASLSEILDAVQQRVWGVELDEFSGWLAWVFYEVALWPYCLTARRRLRNPVRAGDALDLDPGLFGTADVVVGNPPYGRVTLRRAHRERFARSLYGHANLYGLFTDLAVRLATSTGIIGYVTPASFLGGQYFRNLRALLAAEAPPVAIDFIADRGGVFEDVLQETVLVALGRGRALSPVAVHFNRPTGVDSPCDVSPVGAFPIPAEAHAPWLLPRTPNDIALLTRAAAMPHRLRDYGYEVSTGPLVWNRHKPQLADRPGARRLPLLWAECVMPGEFRFTADRRNHVPWFKLGDEQEHLVQRSPCVLVQRTTAKEQSRRLVAAALPARFIEQHGGAVVENHVNMIRPGRRAHAQAEGVAPIEAITALLNTPVVDQLFRCVSGSVAVSAYELEALPVPPPDSMRRLARLVERGASQAKIGRFVERLYLGTP